jgi:DNA processing protein
VLAGGQDKIYPAEHESLLESVLPSGAAISEMPLGWEPRARDFPRRNRLISGLALGVVIVEAAKRSGSLITARLAAEQGREVFAVPGSPLDPRCRGANDLIRRGATLTETAEDVLTQLGPLVREAPPPPPVLPLAIEERWSLNATRIGAGDPMADENALGIILERLGPTPVAVDELVRQCQLTASAVATLLLELELSGRVERHPGNLVSLR